MSSKPHHIIYGGSFNPVHKGHVRVVQYLLQEAIECVVVVPAYCSPFKQTASMLPAPLRLQMLQQVFQNWDRVCVSELEIFREAPSYTYQTVETLCSQESDASWSLVMGADTYQSFHLWKQAKHILELVSLWVIQRPGYQFPSEHTDPLQALYPQELKSVRSKKVRFFEFDTPDISSTAIREQQVSLQSTIPSDAQTLYLEWLSKK